LKQFKRRAGLRGSTGQLHQKHTAWKGKGRVATHSVSRETEVGIRSNQCVFDGAELGSTGGLVEEWSCPDLSTVIAKKTYNCKRKYSARNGISSL